MGTNQIGRKSRKGKNISPPLGIEPRTCRLTADRSANGALEAIYWAARFIGTPQTIKKIKQKPELSPEGFEPPTFGSGIQRAAVAPWALKTPHTMQYHTLYYQFYLHRIIIKLRTMLIASRAPLAERSAVNRQVLGSIPSGGVQGCIYLLTLFNFVLNMWKWQ